MTAKEFLRQANRLDELINSDIRELDKLKDLSISVGAQRYDVERVQSSKQSSHLENAVIKICELERKIDSEVDAFIDLKNDIREAINGLMNRNEQLLLRLRYIEFMSWTEIIDRMGLSEKQIYRIHGEGLQNIIVPEKYCGR